MTKDKIGGTADSAASLHARIASLLAERGHGAIDRDASLFLSGLLDSLAAAEVIGLLESDFGLDLSDPDFDITQIDTLSRLDTLVHRLSA